TAARLSELLNAGPCQPLATYSIRLRCEWRGPIVVEPDGDHYRAAVPEAVVILGDDRRIALGTMLVALRPESGDAWSFAFALPSPLRFTDKAGTPEMDAAFASVTVQGVWRPAAAGVTDLRAVASGLRLTSPTDSHAVSLANLSLTGLLTEDRDGRWSGPLALALNGLAIPAGDGDDLIRLGSASLEGTVSGLDLALARRRHAEQHSATEPPAAAPQPPAPLAPGARPQAAPSKERLRATALHYLTRLGGLFDGAALHLALADLRVKVPMMDTAVSLGRFDYRTAFEGLEHGRSTLAVTYEHGPLAVQPPPPLQEFLPKTARFALIATGLPNETLRQALERTLASESRTSDGLIKTFLAEADTALTQAGTRLTIERFGIDTPATTVALTGEARYDATAALGMVARSEMSIRGFDVAMKALQPAPGAAPLGEDVKTVLSMLTMLQVMGQPGKDEAGRDARTYKIQVSETGAVDLNGADVTMLIQSLRDRLARPKPVTTPPPPR
ncbi:MAG: hypothetical protein WCJ64_13935, partial [Rhodospirillaceae bacterium]